MFYTFGFDNPFNREKFMEKFTAQDIQQIRDLQRSGGQTPPAAPGGATPPATPPNTDGNTPPATPPPAAPPPANGGSASQTGTPPPATTPPSTPPATPPTIDLEKLGFKSYEDLQGAISRIPTLEKELQQLNEYKAGPKFKSERHKFLYEVGSKAEGMELSAVRQLLDVVELLDNKDVPDQHIRFEAFKLRPENKHLSQEEVRSLFADEELERFGNPQDTVNPQTDIQKIRAKQATAQARETLQKFKSDWDATRTVEPTPQELAAQKAEYTQFLQTQLATFDGVSGIKLSGIDSGNEKVEGAINFKIDPQKQLPVVMEAIADPQGWWDRKLAELGILTPGKDVPDFQKWADFVTRVEFNGDLLNLAYQQAISDLEAKKLASARNLGNNGGGNGSAGAPPAPVDERKEANQGAMKVAGIK
ncbi:MAG TPA: hypothetical protein VGD31_08465 [Sphingobacteriaceae bacterium]